jgi:hypothetical protein
MQVVRKLSELKYRLSTLQLLTKRGVLQPSCLAFNCTVVTENFRTIEQLHRMDHCQECLRYQYELAIPKGWRGLILRAKLALLGSDDA